MPSALLSRAECMISALCSSESLPSMPYTAASTTARVWSWTPEASPDMLKQPMTSPFRPWMGEAEQVQPWCVRQ